MRKELGPELEKPESWDYEHPEVREPVKSPRVVVSVAFRRNDFALVSEYAERTGKKVSEFIREAAVEKATGVAGGSQKYGTGSPGAQWWLDPIPTIARVTGYLVKQPTVSTNVRDQSQSPVSVSIGDSVLPGF